MNGCEDPRLAFTVIGNGKPVGRGCCDEIDKPRTMVVNW